MAESVKNIELAYKILKEYTREELIQFIQYLTKYRKILSSFVDVKLK